MSAAGSHPRFPRRTAERLRFGAFELDTSSGELRSTATPDRNEKTVLREQVFQVLRMLLEHEGAIVTREEIKNRLWSDDTIVDFDRSINGTINALRRVLGDSADNPRYIETLARRGYRFMLPIEHLESAPAPALEEGRERQAVSAIPESENAPGSLRRARPRWWTLAFMIAFAVVLVSAGYLSWRRFRPAPTPKSQKITLAVLPFENLTGDPGKEYLADGLTEQAISQLGRLNPERLGVIARTSVMGYKHKDVRLDQIGRDLSVQYVLENSLRANGNQLRLTTQLIQVKDQTHLWSRDYDYPAENVLNVEEDMAKSVAKEIQLLLTLQQQVEVTRPHSVNPAAFDSYLQGYYFFERNTDKDTEMAGKYFERATQLDPSYALAWVGLSRVRKWQAMMQIIPADEGYRQAREAVERALAFEPNLAEAHIQMGRMKQQVDLDFAGADASYQRAAALAPEKPEAQSMAAYSALFLGRFDEALQESRRAIDLDPLNAIGWIGIADVEFHMGRLDEAAAHSRKALELNPDVFPGSELLSRIYLLQGRPQDALREAERVRYEPFRSMLYSLACYSLGRKRESDAALSELIAKHPQSAYPIAEVYAFRNQPDDAFAWLDRAYAQRNSGLIETKIDPSLKSLHNDPRFGALLKKLNFP